MVETGNALFALLFGKMKGLPGTVTAQPNIFDGVDYVTSSGEVLGSVKESVLGLDLVNSHGQTIGHVTENVYGGITVDMVNGPNIVGMPGVMGEKFYMGGEYIGFEAPNIFGGTDFMGAGGTHLASGWEGVLGEKFHLSDALPELGGMTDFSLNSFDVLNGVYGFGDAADVVEAMNALDAADIIDLLTGFF